MAKRASLLACLKPMHLPAAPVAWEELADNPPDDGPAVDADLNNYVIRLDFKGGGDIRNDGQELEREAAALIAADPHCFHAAEARQATLPCLPGCSEPAL